MKTRTAYIEELQMISYAIYFYPISPITMNDLRKADCLNAGLLENAYDDLFVWHGVSDADLMRVVKYIGLEFNVRAVEVSTEVDGYKEIGSCIVFYK
jgi:hypothetical protein